MGLFTESHLAQQKKIHEESPVYGQSSLVFAPMVSELIDSNEVSELLDYGAGLSELKDNLDTQNPLDVYAYDPAFDEISALPDPCQMVACLDVLDNVEEGCIDDVLDDLKRVILRIGFFSISTGDNGTNEPFKTVRPVEWWLPKILERFELHYFSRIQGGFVVVVKAYPKAN